MTITTPAQDLEPAHAEIVTATLPLVGANIDAITREFYRRLFDAHPSLLRNLFNSARWPRPSRHSRPTW